MAIKTAQFSNRSYVDLVLEVKELSVNQNANTSVVSVEAYAYCANRQTYNLESSAKLKLTVESTSYYSSATYDFRSKSKDLVVSKQLTIPHLDSGEKNVSASVSFSDNFLGSASVSLNLPLTSIKRGTRILFPSSIYADATSIDISSHKITTTDTEEISYKIGGTTIATWSVANVPSLKSSGRHILPLSSSQISTVYRLMSKSTSITASFEVTTKRSNGTTIATRSYPTRVVLSSSDLPRVDLVQIKTTTKDLDGEIWNIAVVNYGTIEATVEVTPSKGATIVATRVGHAGKPLKIEGGKIRFTPTTVNATGNAVIDFYVEDSRGLKVSGSKEITVYKHHAPYYEFFNLERGASGSAQERVAITHAYGKIADIRYGYKTNQADLKIYAVPTNGHNETLILSQTGSQAVNTSKHTDYTKSLSVSESFNIKIVYRDKFAKVEVVRKLGTGSFPLIVSKVGIGINKVPEPNRNFDGKGSFYWNDKPFNFVASTRSSASITLDYSAISGANDCKVYKDNFTNIIWLTGYFNVDKEGSNTVGTLPAGYRPHKELYFPVFNRTGNGHIAIDSSGKIYLRGFTKVGSGPWVSLDHITFFRIGSN